MSLLKKIKIPAFQQIPVSYEVEGSPIDIGQLPRVLRKPMESVGAKFQRKFSDLVHPETGDRPRLVIFVPNARKPQVQARLVTDNEQTRAWLKEAKNIDILGEEIKAPAQAESA